MSARDENAGLGNQAGGKLSDTVDLYKAYLDDLGRIGARHETLRQFYVTVISALFVLLGLAGKDGILVNVRGIALLTVAGLGFCICLLWMLHMRSFSRIFKAKMGALRAMEAKAMLPIMPFTTEDLVDKDIEEGASTGKPEGKRTRLTTIDQRLAGVFMVMFLALGAFKFVRSLDAPAPTATVKSAPASP